MSQKGWGSTISLGLTDMTDSLSPTQRSQRMSKVRSSGNHSTELRVAATLARHSISGWTRQAKDIFGRPDFFFPDLNLVIFVNGCFWHGCPKCCRNTPKTRSLFWLNKIEANRKRDRRVNRVLRAEGYQVLRVWEHELAKRLWLKRVERTIQRIREADDMGDICK